MKKLLVGGLVTVALAALYAFFNPDHQPDIGGNRYTGQHDYLIKRQRRNGLVGRD